MSASLKITRTDTGAEWYIFEKDIEVVRANGSGSVINMFGLPNIEADETPAAIQTALGGQLIPATEAGATVYIGRANLYRVVDDGSDDAVFVFTNERSIETTTIFSTLGTILQATIVYAGSGTPEAAVTASPGSLYVDTDGGASVTLYVKESGTAATGWVAK